MTTRFAPAPGPHGGDAPRLAALLDVAPESVLDLSVSLNPCPPDVASLVAAHAGAVRHYPDPGPATAARAALAIQPAQPDRAPRGPDRARRGLGRGVLRARHRPLDPR
jgi:histidinol-phosphate/aromatic aminotransferase/cobyric acid decarboxylase-like protein